MVSTTRSRRQAARLSVGIGPTGFWLRRARYYVRGRQRRGGSLQLVAGGLGRFIKRHLLLGLGNAFVGICFVLIAVAQSFPQFFSLDGHVTRRRRRPSIL